MKKLIKWVGFSIFIRNVQSQEWVGQQTIDMNNRIRVITKGTK